MSSCSAASPEGRNGHRRESAAGRRGLAAGRCGLAAVRILSEGFPQIVNQKSILQREIWPPRNLGDRDCFDSDKFLSK